MWPWGHLAVGYLLYTPLARLRFGEAPSGRATLLLAFGTQFPDLIDKPLAWGVDVLPAGRTLAHSLLTAAVLTTLVYAYSKRRDRPDVGLAFTVGYASHPFADALFPLLNGQYQYAAYLFWPLFGLPSWVGIRTVLVEPLEVLLGAEPIDVDITIHMLTELVLVVLAVRTWRRDGAPAVAALRNRLDSTHEPGSGPDG